MDRVLSSPSKQKALVRLMSSDPSLLNGLDDDLLSSITLLSEPPRKGYHRRPVLLGQEANRDTTVRKNIQLYPEDAAFAEKKKTPAPMLLPGGISNATRAALTRANTVLLSPSSNAAAVAATASSKQGGRMTSAFMSTSVVRNTLAPVIQQDKPPPLVLLDDNMLNLVDRGTKVKTRGIGSTKKNAKRARRRERKKNSTTSSSSGSSAINSEDERYCSKTQGATSRTSAEGANDCTSFVSDSDEGTQIASQTAASSRLLLDHHHFVSRDQWIPRR
ncbi:1-phosphatidylinositol 3-phosphate 5-kinase FAB1 [Phytophthora cinnamomi]|uniref:1-phosphatidylinositol 3-phosphate 5-kinase FAB1 n=1 Tax=Phytophthora cinnamomi TaxID=4785 RepID=UPI0035596028|nr:1-phosphatidylinositol 3-phosphate 5-kinase FAB1 [Phytophthora cinnamomi]